MVGYGPRLESGSKSRSRSEHVVLDKMMMAGSFDETET
jgi:hypothetical protein